MVTFSGARIGSDSEEGDVVFLKEVREESAGAGRAEAVAARRERKAAGIIFAVVDEGVNRAEGTERGGEGKLEVVETHGILYSPVCIERRVTAVAGSTWMGSFRGFGETKSWASEARRLDRPFGEEARSTKRRVRGRGLGSEDEARLGMLYLDGLRGAADPRRRSRIGSESHSILEFMVQRCRPLSHFLTVVIRDLCRTCVDHRIRLRS